MSFKLESIAPRLALARDQHNAYVAERDRLYHVKVAKTLQAERLVAHRELQLQRAFKTRDASYIKLRQRKLRAAQRVLERVSSR